MPLRVWSWLLSLSILWGGSFFFAKIAVSELGPLSVVSVRVGVAAIALVLVLAVLGRLPLRANAPWSDYLVMGLLNNALPFSLIFWGQTQIASGLAAILNATTPLFTMVVAHLSTADEKLTGVKIAALATGLVGVAILVGPDVLIGGSGLWGELACVAAAVSYAVAGVFGRRFKAMNVGAMEAAAGQLTASAVLILPIMLMVERPWMSWSLPSTGVLAALAGLALLSTALGYVLYFRILAAAGATNLLLVTLMIPPTSIVLGACFLNERLLPRQVGGMALIGLGLLLMNGRVRLWRPAAK
jgi:drug/metabolite transporter (DMT)-like permease